VIVDKGLGGMILESELLQNLSIDKFGRPVRLKFAPNEDGLGPTNALLYIAEGLAWVAENHGIALELTVQNSANADFNAREYNRLKESYPCIRGVYPRKRHSIIQLVKEGEQVIALKTAEKLLDYHRYTEANRTYQSDLVSYHQAELLEIQGCQYDAYLCMGTPAIHRAPYENNLLVFEIFDHSWVLSLIRIIEDDRSENPHEWKTRRVRDVPGADAKLGNEWPDRWRDELLYTVLRRDILPTIEADDAKVHHVLMFPEPLAPGEFFSKWSSLVPGRVKRFEGVLKGWPSAERESERVAARQTLAKLWFGDADYLNEAQIFLVQGGGTPTWDNLLLKMVAQCLGAWEQRLGKTIFMFTERSVKKAFDRPILTHDWGWPNFEALARLIEQSRTIKLINGSELKSFQMFYLVADFVFSRPGGITVQDAIACRTPIACAAEPGHWQTEKIRDHCELYHVMRSVPFEAFETGGIGTVVDQFGMDRDNQQMIKIMETFDNQIERSIAQKVLEIIASQHTDTSDLSES
jgi:hypothetical protein